MLLTRLPLYSQDCSHFLVRLACVRHAASVDSEPGSNSPFFPYEASSPCLAVSRLTKEFSLVLLPSYYFLCTTLSVIPLLVILIHYSISLNRLFWLALSGFQRPRRLPPSPAFSAVDEYAAQSLHILGPLPSPVK